MQGPAARTMRREQERAHHAAPDPQRTQHQQEQYSMYNMLLPFLVTFTTPQQGSNHNEERVAAMKRTINGRGRTRTIIIRTHHHHSPHHQE
jgi:hypothetical protein